MSNHLNPFQDPNFEVLSPINHNDLGGQWSEVTKTSGFRIFHSIYYCIILSSSIGIIFLYISSNESLLTSLLNTFIGFSLVILILPIHEVIHYISFTAFGAKTVRIKMYLRQGLVLTIADKFFAERKQMIWISIVPFVVLSIGCILLLPFLSNNYLIIALSILLFHTSISYNDIRMADFFLKKGKDIYLYSDLSKNTTYFFKRTFS